jgi:predicted small secreted protein
MKLRDFLIGVATGVAASIIIKEASEKISPFVPANKVLDNVKDEFKKESPIDGSWIYMKAEDFNNGIMSIPVYRGGITRMNNGELETFDFAADARSGVVVELTKS